MAEQNTNMHFGVNILTQREYNELKEQSEQLRILKNYIRNKEVLLKSEIERLLDAMESERGSNE